MGIIQISRIRIRAECGSYKPSTEGEGERAAGKRRAGPLSSLDSQSSQSFSSKFRENIYLKKIRQRQIDHSRPA